MSYIGNPIISTDFPKDTFSGNGSTTAFTMSIAPASVNAVIVVVSGITQDPSTYTISGTTLTFSAAPPTGTDNISVRHLGVAGIPNTPSDASVTSSKLAAGAITSSALPVGTVLQVVSTTKTDTFSTTSTTYTDITGLSVSITPKSATSTIYAVVTLGMSSNSGTRAAFQLLRNSTSIGVGATAGSRTTANSAGQPAAPASMAAIRFQHLDSPATTSAITYKVQTAFIDYDGTLYINRTVNDEDTASRSRTSSTITVMEIAA